MQAQKHKSELPDIARVCQHLLLPLLDVTDLGVLACSSTALKAVMYKAPAAIWEAAARCENRNRFGCIALAPYLLAEDCVSSTSGFGDVAWLIKPSAQSVSLQGSDAKGLARLQTMLSSAQQLCCAVYQCCQVAFASSSAFILQLEVSITHL